MSIDGQVIAVQGDTIKSHLVIDETQPIGEANWFQFNTSYTTESQTGLYLMPQVGDNIKLYLPEADEDKSYMRVINRQDGSKNEKTQDTKTKYLGNTYGKELKMAPKELKFTTTDGLMYIKMTDEAGIEIESDKEILIKSDDVIEIKGKSISMMARDNIYFKAKESSMSMDNITHFKANKITINGTIKS